jgi:hypothetical protein
MTSLAPGVATSECEVTNIGQHGFWLLVDDREYFVPFTDYPAFRSATVTQIYAVERIAPDQLCWPALDIDIDTASLAHPEAFPLIFKGPLQVSYKPLAVSR